jgi:hypothetical protein
MQGAAVGGALGAALPAVPALVAELHDSAGRHDIADELVALANRGATKGRTLARAAGGGLLLGGLAALRSEASRQKAKKMSKNPSSVMAELEKTRRRRRVRSEAKTLARVQAARQGRKVQGNPLVRIDRADGGK